jgi:N4-(beta-N-acetylglucosaminyl)-L-asparaginase
MDHKASRREFITAGGAAALIPLAQGPTVLIPQSVTPVVVASANGNRYKNGGTRTTVEEAFARIVKGEDVLDALIAGVNICELDPAEMGVGYGALPDADGVVTLDASCMHGPRRRAGGVACLAGVRAPSVVARAVMDQTDHHLLVGAGAQAFARSLGMKIEDDLNTDASRQRWLEWKRRTDPQHYLDPVKRGAAGDRVRLEMIAEGKIDAEHAFGTINCNGINAKGELCGVTTTSGLAWKIPGRVGDSPILGAGLYVDGEVGAAGSTGRGEANMFALSSFVIMEQLRQGRHPKDAGIEALRRIKANTVEKRLLDDRGLPTFSVNFYIVDRKGRYAGVGLYSAGPKGVTRQYAVCTDSGPATLPLEGLLGQQG